MDIKRKILSSSLCIIAALFMIFIMCANNAEAVQTQVTQKGIKAENNLLQFTAGKHVLGFTPNKAYLAAMDHALSLEFLGTKGVAPKSDRNVSSNKHSRTLPMGKVTYDNLWEGISLTYEATTDGIAESTYHVAPQADVSKIRLKYNAPVEMQKDGQLKFKFGKGYMTESAPVAWQEINGKKKPVEVAFRVKGGEVGFSVGKYDPKYALIIDPKYEWHTFYGSAYYDDYGYGIAVDSSGNVYVVGYSDAYVPNLYRGNADTAGISDSPKRSSQPVSQKYSGNSNVTGISKTTAPPGGWDGPGGVAPLNAPIGGSDIVVLKLNSSGAYQWHTFYGSWNDDYGYGIALDAGGNVYVTGQSAYSWNGPGDESPLNSHSGYYDVVVLKLNSSGTYQWHTFYGSGDGYTEGDDIAIDGSGNVYVTGTSDLGWNGPGSESPLNPYSDSPDIFVLKLNGSGTYLWHTFYGSSSDDKGDGVAIDGSGNVYVTGMSYLGWNGPGDESPLNAHPGSYAIVVLKLTSSGAYQWHTFYGSVNGNGGRAIAVDANSNVYVAGYSYGTWNGHGGESPLNPFSGYQDDIVVLKLNSSGAYRWHTFYGTGTNSWNGGRGIAVDAKSNVYVTGFSESTWGTPLNPYSGDNDIFILKLNSSGAYQWNTFYGVSSYESSGQGIALDPSGSIYVAGYSYGTWNGPGGKAPLNPFSGFSDIAVLKMSQSIRVTAKAKGTGAGKIVTSPAGISYSFPANATGSAMYLEGSNVVIAAKANTGSIATWGGTCAAAGGTAANNNTGKATCTISNLSEAATITATFSKQNDTYRIRMNADGIGTGSVTSSPAGISYNYPGASTGLALFKKGTTVVLTAKAGTARRATWNGTCAASGGTEAGNGTVTATCTYRNLGGSKTATVTFRRNHIY